MTPTVAFVIAFASTLACLALAVATGLRARRGRHLAAVAGALASLGVTIYFALELGELYDLASAGVITPIHHVLARVTTACYLLPIASGVWTILNPARRKLHRKLAFFVLAMTVATAVTGTWMLCLADPIESAAAVRAGADREGGIIPHQRG